MNNDVEACIWGFLRIAGFGLTLPATKAAIPLFGVVAVGIGHAVVENATGVICSSGRRDE